MAFGLSAGAIGLIGAGAAVAGGAIAANGAKSAAKTQAQAAQDSTALQKDIFDKQVELNAPFRDTGLAANNRLAFLLGLNPGAPTGAPVAGAQGAVPAQSFGGLPASTVNAIDHVMPGFSGVSQLLQQGPDGVFQPQAQQQSFAAATPVPAGPAGTALTQLGLSDRFNVSPDGQSFVSRSTGQSIPLSYFTSGQYQNEAQTGNFGQYQSSIVPQAQAPASASLPPANDFSGFGSLSQNFNAGDFAADGAPKIAPFTQNVPQAQQFAQYGGSTPVGQFTDNTNLSDFQDMPAFNADAMKEDPGYQFRLDQGNKALTNTYAGKGNFFSGAAMKGIDRYNQDYASNEYGNAFNRYQTTRGNKLQDYLTNRDTANQNRNNALSTYSTNRDTTNLNNSNNRQDYATNLATQQQNYQNQNTAYTNNLNQFSLNRNNALQDYQTAYDRFQTNRSNTINPLLSMMGYGQQATAGTSNAAANYGNQAAAAIQSAGNANAAGQVGSANALNGAIGSAVGGFQQNQLMNLLLSRQNTAGVPPPANPNYSGTQMYGTAYSGF